MAYRVTIVEGIKQSPRRSISFIESDSDDKLDAKRCFDQLNVKQKYDLMARFEHWIDLKVFTDYHHGFSDSLHYVFKWRRSTTKYRIYGFLCHPKKDDKSFLVCVLACYAQKNEEETDTKIRSHLSRLLQNTDVQNAILHTYLGDKQNEQHKHDPQQLIGRKKPALDRPKR